MKLNPKLQSSPVNLSRFAIARLAREYKTLEALDDEETNKAEKVLENSIETLQRRFD
jgi:hypothetical protein